MNKRKSALIKGGIVAGTAAVAKAFGASNSTIGHLAGGLSQGFTAAPKKDEEEEKRKPKAGMIGRSFSNMRQRRLAKKYGGSVMTK